MEDLKWRMTWRDDGVERLTHFRSLAERDDHAAQMLAAERSDVADVRVQSLVDGVWCEDALPDIEVSRTFRLTERQRLRLLWALSDAYAYREQEDEGNDDYEDVDAPRRQWAAFLHELFGGNPDHI